MTCRGVATKHKNKAWVTTTEHLPSRHEGKYVLLIPQPDKTLVNGKLHQRYIGGPHGFGFFGAGRSVSSAGLSAFDSFDTEYFVEILCHTAQIVWRVVMPQVWTELFDPTEFDMTDDRATLGSVILAVIQSCDQVI